MSIVTRQLIVFLTKKDQGIRLDFSKLSMNSPRLVTPTLSHQLAPNSYHLHYHTDCDTSENPTDCSSANKCSAAVRHRCIERG